MNKKAAGFEKFLQERNITCFKVEEMPKDELNAVVFRSQIEVEGQNLPTILIVYDSIYCMLRVLVASKALRENKIGSAIPHLNKKLFKAIEVPVPPYNEQVRIVAAINSALNRLDAIMENL